MALARRLPPRAPIWEARAEDLAARQQAQQELVDALSADTAESASACEPVPAHYAHWRR